MFRLLGKSIVTLGASGAAYYTYRSWDDQKKQQCLKVEERAIRQLPRSITEEYGSLLERILKSRENGRKDE